MLNNHYINLIFIHFILFTNLIFAYEVNNLGSSNKKYNISVCAIFKDEALYLEEWLDYHLELGIDHFYLYNIESKDCYKKILKNYIKKNIVTLMNWPEVLSYHDDQALRWALSTQIPAYENAVNFLARNETEWLVFLDINEFLTLSQGDIKILLSQYQQFSGVAFQTELFDRTIYHPFIEKLLQKESFEIIDYPLEVIDKAVVKMIFKPEECIGFSWPPYQCRFKELASIAQIESQELGLRRFINRKVVMRDFSLQKKISQFANPCILDQKKNKPLDYPIYPYVPEFLKKLKKNI